MAAQPGTTSVNIAILDSRDFPTDLGPVEELFSEFAMSDGRVLFECPGLCKVTGIDLMNCPLNVMLKLRVRRRTPQGPAVLWHVLLPLPTISKYFLSPPHEWETWIGLFPNTQNLDSHGPDVMFTQAVHLINRPEYPKLRLRFTYDNPELRAQYEREKERQDQVKNQRDQLLTQHGKTSFESTHNFLRGLRDDSLKDSAASASGGSVAVAPAAATTVPAVAMDAQPMAAPAVRSVGGGSEREALLKALAFINEVGYNLSQCLPPLPLPSPLRSEEAAAIEKHCGDLQACLAMKCGQGGAGGAGLDAESEQLLAEGLRMALMGMLEDSDGGKLPRTSTNLSLSTNSQLETLRARFPRLWDACREVSALAKERASLLEQLGSLSRGAEARSSNFEQAQAQQLRFEADLETMRRQRDEARSAAQDREVEIGKLRLQLDQLMRHQGLSSVGRGFPN